MRVAGVAVWAPLAYAGGARALVHALKFRGAPRLADVMAAQISANAPPGLLWGATLVPVPLHHARLRRRGFNQAALLAAALASRCDGRVSECLRRPASDAPQVGRGRAERLTALEEAVEMRAHKPLPNRAVLIDDVVTTGATIAACACALRRGGAPSVVAIAYARTPGR